MSGFVRCFGLAASLSLALALTSTSAATAREWTDGGEDEQIAISIRAEMARHSIAWANMARFQVLDHEVYLHGHVSTHKEAADEVDIIRGVPGVERVFDLTSTFNG